MITRTHTTDVHRSARFVWADEAVRFHEREAYDNVEALTREAVADINIDWLTVVDDTIDRILEVTI